MNAKISILFYVKRAKTTAKGLVPIYLRVTVDGIRIEIATKRFVESSKWSVSAGKMKGNSEESRSINSYLDILKGKVYDAQKEILQNDDRVTAATMKNKILGIEEKGHMLITIFKDHNKRMEALIGKEYSLSTHKRYETTLQHTINFMKWKFSISDINIKDINLSFITDFEFYLRTVRNCNNNSTIKYIKNFGKIIRICVANGWLQSDPFMNFKCKIQEVERVYLTEEEIKRIYDKTFNTIRLNQVKDIFLFSCYTGLAYIDVKQLTHNNLIVGIDGTKWISTHRQKTETLSKIPLLPIAEEIVQKYTDHPQCISEEVLLPVPSNQKMNEYLKEIATICEINKELTSHSARHTFATSVTLTNGVPIESVSKMLGHKNLKTTQHYAKILDQKISTDMSALREKLIQKNNTDKNNSLKKSL
ncbi:site-specific integrase [Flavobacterium limnosediminis]|nr:site-specific integrase [Flavobacterium limnosediminis]